MSVRYYFFKGCPKLIIFVEWTLQVLLLGFKKGPQESWAITVLGRWNKNEGKVPQNNLILWACLGNALVIFLTFLPLNVWDILVAKQPSLEEWQIAIWSESCPDFFILLMGQFKDNLKRKIYLFRCYNRSLTKYKDII
jgi:hypothetical protein